MRWPIRAARTVWSISAPGVGACSTEADGSGSGPKPYAVTRSATGYARAARRSFVRSNHCHPEEGRRRMTLRDDPGPAAVRGQQPAKNHAWKMSRGDRRRGAFDLSGKGVPRFLGQFGIDVAQTGPFLIQQLHRAMDDIAQQQAA